MSAREVRVRPRVAYGCDRDTNGSRRARMRDGGGLWSYVKGLGQRISAKWDKLRGKELSYDDERKRDMDNLGSRDKSARAFVDRMDNYIKNIADGRAVSSSKTELIGLLRARLGKVTSKGKEVMNEKVKTDLLGRFERALDSLIEGRASAGEFSGVVVEMAAAMRGRLSSLSASIFKKDPRGAALAQSAVDAWNCLRSKGQQDPGLRHSASDALLCVLSFITDDYEDGTGQAFHYCLYRYGAPMTDANRIISSSDVFSPDKSYCQKGSSNKSGGSAQQPLSWQQVARFL